jgi:hypothetical protein
MKKPVFIIIAMLFFALSNSNAQTSSTQTVAAPQIVTDFFEGNWELNLIGVPEGDAKLLMNLTRKDGKLTGELADLQSKEAVNITLSNVEETAERLTIYFSARGYDLSVYLDKVDNDNLSGRLVEMFDAKAKRIKE